MFFSPNQPLKTSQRALPHWRQTGVIYFVTFRLGDSIPADKLRTWREERDLWLAQNGQPTTEQAQADYDARFSMRLETWLDSGMGSCLLHEKRAIETVASALNHFDKDRYLLDHWVIMPNHVHLLAMPPTTIRCRKFFIPGNHSPQSSSISNSNAMAYFGKMNPITESSAMKLNCSIIVSIF
ncbi:hypothetical protein [Cerasicoccus maritimus]|uniref:hypothetical protein n=1 Tax=Cerasicoccus maritimus TaxID=490089 RepID=UPI002852C924|nr:hypothetical protein [Cerasicoccus maritimus]